MPSSGIFQNQVVYAVDYEHDGANMDSYYRSLCDEKILIELSNVRI